MRAIWAKGQPCLAAAKCAITALASIFGFLGIRTRIAEHPARRNKRNQRPLFCLLEALTEALERFGTPQIFNTDQGSQFTSDDFIQALKDRDIDISMDGKGRWIDNVFIERLWRNVKYEEVYVKAYDSIPEARAGLKNYFDLYNLRRPHQGLDERTPDAVYWATRDPLPTAV